MKYIISIKVFVLLLTGALSCFAHINQNITIRGEFANGLMEGELISLIVSADYAAINAPLVNGTVYKTTVSQGHFSFVIANPPPYGYFQLIPDSYKNSRIYRKVKPWRMFYGKFFLITPGSSVAIKVDSDDVYFTGQGAGLMECQWKMMKIVEGRQGIKMDSDWYKANVDDQAQSDSLFASQMKVLRSYSKYVSDLQSRLLTTDYLYDWNYEQIMNLKMSIAAITDLSRQKAAFAYYTDHYLFKPIDTADLAVKLKSRSYINYALLKQGMDVGSLFNIASVRVRINFSQIYDILCQNYHGALRDKLIAACFLEYYTFGRAENWYFDDALHKMVTPEYKTIVQKMKDAYDVGKPGFNFNLVDTAGQMVTQNSLKGKLLVLDFWFTGCSGCSYLNENMTPIFNHYKKNPNILFVSITIDNDSDMWKKSILSGKYTHPGSLNLCTKGTNNPVIKNYHITTYPTLILIDKNGNLISGNPPSPITEEDTSRFLRLIEEHL